MSLPLEGVTVIDLTQVVSGAVSTMLMAEFGADVIKVEPPGGEAYRKFGTPISGEHGETNMNILRWSRGKRSVVIDLKTTEGQEVLWGLIERCDVLVENFRPGKLAALGFPSERIHAANPQLIYTSVSGFGHSDLLPSPNSELPVYALIAEAMAGITYLAADKDENPIWLGFAMGDILSGVLAFSGTLLSLRQREMAAAESRPVGHPLRVDIAMHDSCLFMNDQSILKYAVTGKVDPPGRKYSLQSPWGFYRAKDGHFAIAVMTPGQWQALCDTIERPDLAANPELNTGTERSRRHEQLIAPAIQAWAADISKHAAVEALAAVGVPSAPVNHAGEVVDSEQTTARAMMVPVTDANLGEIRQVGNPIKIAGPAKPEIPNISALGQDTAEVLTDVLGLGQDELARLLESGAVQGRAVVERANEAYAE